MKEILWQEYKPIPGLLVTFDHVVAKGDYENIKTIIYEPHGLQEQRYKIRIEETDVYKFKETPHRTLYCSLRSLLFVLEDKYGKALLKSYKDCGIPYKRAIGKEYELLIHEPIADIAPILVVFDDVTYAIAPIILDDESERKVTTVEPIGEPKILKEPKEEEEEKQEDNSKEEKKEEVEDMIEMPSEIEMLNNMGYDATDELPPHIVHNVEILSNDWEQPLEFTLEEIRRIIEEENYFNLEYNDGDSDGIVEFSYGEPKRFIIKQRNRNE